MQKAKDTLFSCIRTSLKLAWKDIVIFSVFSVFSLLLAHMTVIPIHELGHVLFQETLEPNTVISVCWLDAKVFAVGDCEPEVREYQEKRSGDPLLFSGYVRHRHTPLTQSVHGTYEVVWGCIWPTISFINTLVFIYFFIKKEVSKLGELERD